jgi:methanogenic corrinoid protein MtbC1
VQAEIERNLRRDSLRDLVLEALVPLIVAIGEAWACGRLEVFEEHLLTQQIRRYLEGIIGRLPRPTAGDAAVLATLPGERHGFGLLMVEALLRAKRRCVVNLGTEVPLDQLVQAVERTPAPFVALSFSAAYPYAAVRAHLHELERRLPPETRVWVGGEAVRRLRKLPRAVQKVSLEQL